MVSTSRINAALMSIKNTFLMLPEQSMAHGSVADLCQLDHDVCKNLLAALHDVGFLSCDASGRYRLAQSHPSRSVPSDDGPGMSTPLAADLRVGPGRREL
jgi:hypothetical protein